MPEIFILKLNEIQPSQLYISSSKLARVRKTFNYLTTGALTPVTVKKLGDDIIYTDGHTRAFAAFMNNQTEIRAVWDEDDEDWEAYKICVQWCKDEGIHKIADLKDRVIPSDEYEKLWLNRCRDMHKELGER